MIDVEQTIREYLPGVIHMSLATSAGNKPWVCEVHYAFDVELNLYFRSKPSRRHSQEIAQNPNVAGNIVEAHGLTDKPRAVYFEGRAEPLEEVNKNHIAYKLIHERLGLGPEVLEDAKQDDGHKFYKITVSNYYLFDTRES
ncbi:MAG TPA: pyridoxamine 5'-phosphate oxidase family protein, partial [Candidatus Saccharimonadales bacterium]|nr:pyridoxamine 5'-phosphate oxidase family protein [Candidatus Saccharimonadales bacterium]